MVKFFMKTFMLISVLLFGIILGMQQANNGLRMMKGYEESFEGAFEIKKDSKGELEAGVLGNELTSHDLKEKQKKLEEIDAFNLFSTLGAKLSESVSVLFKKLLSLSFILPT